MKITESVLSYHNKTKHRVIRIDEERERKDKTKSRKVGNVRVIHTMWSSNGTVQSPRQCHFRDTMGNKKSVPTVYDQLNKGKQQGR